MPESGTSGSVGVRGSNPPDDLAAGLCRAFGAPESLPRSHDQTNAQGAEGEGWKGRAERREVPRGPESPG